ncbi:Asp-tRNA(Asn)/Glu-tRNA(Gln) amidotransferase subunit GatB [Candidatus Peregrinibacteria bacterium]|nr:MAG: Asp-tRNA(Asn)/Glu-tRNA(Gln) amidotransferase subunit GatB [Candidatus Peregrinibacteria bacterium]
MDLEVIIGLEIHAEMNTRTKMFCACSNDNFGKEPNTNVCPICMGFPGMLPVANVESIKKGAIAAMALNCEIKKHSKFDRKNYFYPDLPSGFQISQYDEPVSENGHIEILVEGKKKRIGIRRLHLENDAGKLTHSTQGTLLDFNRAGKPLMEIVSEPDLRSAKEAKEYAESVQKIVRYSGSSDCDMEKGQMRFDASVSLRPVGDSKLYPRAEIKNLNSFRSLEASIEREIAKQSEAWEAGTPPTIETTVGWDEDKGDTHLLREKESAADYRYFPEPDLPPLELSEEQITEWRKEVPESPLAVYERFLSEYQLNEAEARFFSEDSRFARLFEETAKASKNAKTAASFVGTVLVSRLKEAGKSLADSPITAQHLTQLIQMIDAGKISNNVAKSSVFEAMMQSGKMPAQLVEELGLSQVSDTTAIEELCKKAIEANPEAVADVKAGKSKAMAAIVGSVMKESKGKANPQMVNELLTKLLS